MIENENYKFNGVESKDELFSIEATPSKPENRPYLKQKSFIDTRHLVNDVKEPIWKNIVSTLIVLFIMIVIGLFVAAQGPCPKRNNTYFRNRYSVFCEIGQSILKHDLMAAETFDPIANYPPLKNKGKF